MYLRITTKKYKGETYHYAFLFDSEVVDGKKKPVMKANLGAVTEEQIPYLKAAYAKKKPRLVWDDPEDGKTQGEIP